MEVLNTKVTEYLCADFCKWGLQMYRVRTDYGCTNYVHMEYEVPFVWTLDIRVTDVWIMDWRDLEHTDHLYVDY